MAGPSIAWVDFDIEDLITGPQSAALFTLLRNNQEHLYEIAHTGGYGGGAAHTHASSGAAAVDVPVHENLMIVSCPGLNANREIVSWTFSGFSVNQFFNDNDGSVAGGVSNGSFIHQHLGGSENDESRAMFGANGMDCVVSFFIKPLETTMTAGNITFGFSDNGTAVFSSSASFAYTDLNNGWTRVYARFTGAGAGHATNVRFLMNVTTGFPLALSVTGFQINRGRHLVPWTICNVEGKTSKNGNVNYTDMPDCPLLDQRLSMDEAVDVT